MTSIEEHFKKIKEHLEAIAGAIDEGLEKRPITIGFHCSACSVELLELYLHQLNKITFGKIIKHNWFKRPQDEQKIEPLIERKLPVGFPDKDKVYELIYAVEENRDNLVYGKSDLEQIKLVLNSFLKLKGLIFNKLKAEGVDLEKI